MASRAAPATTPTTASRAEAVAALERRLGHVFSDRALLEQALTHASVGDGARKVADNERLEFLGDRVLGLLTAEHLIASHTADAEGQLSRRLAVAVSRPACARVARRIALGPALRLSAAESKAGGRDKDTVLGDACEALLAALFRDAGLDLTRAIFADIWREEFDALRDPEQRDVKNALQEWAATLQRPLPRYSVVTREGPAHAPRFTVRVQVEGLEPAEGAGGSRQAAEKAAAAALLAREAGA